MPVHEKETNHIHYSLNRELNEMYLAEAIRAFATSLVGIFVPIYVYLFFDKSVVLTALFYGIMYASYVILTPLIMRLMSSLGIKKMMAVAKIFLIAFLLFLLLAEEGGILFIGLSIISGSIFLALFWPASHIDLAKFSKDGKRGRQVGIRNIVISLAAAGGPFIGGLILIKMGFMPLFLLASIFILISSIPLFFSAEVYEVYSLNWRQSFKQLFFRQNKRDALVYFIEGIEWATAIVLLPIFIFIVIDKLDTIGLITSVSLLASTVFIYYVSFNIDKRGAKKVMAIGSVAQAIAWAMVTFIETVMQYLILINFFRLAGAVNRLPLASLYYEKAKKRGAGIDEYVAMRTISHNIGEAFICFVIALGFYLGLTSFIFYFVIAGIASFLFRLMK